MTSIVTGALGFITGVVGGMITNVAGGAIVDAVVPRCFAKKVNGFMGSSLAGTLAVSCIKGDKPFAIGYRVGQTASTVISASAFGMGNEPNDAHTDQLSINEENAKKRYDSGVKWGLLATSVSLYNPIVGIIFSSIVAYSVSSIGSGDTKSVK